MSVMELTQPKLRKIAKNKCSACGKYFAGDSAFNEHRTGDFGKRPQQRRCMTTEEMLANKFESFDALVPEYLGDIGSETKRRVQVAVWRLKMSDWATAQKMARRARLSDG
jgi:hypothetical protein